MKSKINESINVKDFALAFSILKELGKPWEEFEAFKTGLIDKDGKKLKNSSTAEERDSMTSYNKIIINLKRLLQKVVGKNRIVQKTASLFLLKESNLEDRTINIILEKLDLGSIEENTMDSLDENYVYCKTLVQSITQ